MAETIDEFAQLEPLWDKAIQSPTEISLEEKHQILEWPPLAEMQANAQKYLALSVEDLMHKAITVPRSLTYPECRLIYDNFRVLRALDQLKYHGDRRKWLRARPNLKAKSERAYAAVLSDEEAQALENLKDVFYGIQMAHYDAREAKRMQQRPEHLPKEWIQKVIDQGEDRSWDYIFYHRKGMADWEEFERQFDDLMTIPWFDIVGYEDIQDSKVAEFVEFEAKEEGELDHLREDFRNRRERGDLKPGILKNVFFLLTDEARVSYSQTRLYGFIWAIDPDWSLSGADEDGYDGRLKINAAQVWLRFYEFMSTGTMTLKDIWRNFHYVNEMELIVPPMSAWCFTNIGKSVWPDS